MEPEPRHSSLAYFAELTRSGRSLDSLPLCVVKNIDGIFYLENGSQRAVFYHLNGEEVLHAREEVIPATWGFRYHMEKFLAELISKQLRKQGITSVPNLAERVEDSHRYIIR